MNSHSTRAPASLVSVNFNSTPGSMPSFRSRGDFTTIDINSEPAPRSKGADVAPVVHPVNIDLVSEMAPAILGLPLVLVAVFLTHAYVEGDFGVFWWAVLVAALWLLRSMWPGRRQIPVDALDVERALALISLWFVYSGLAHATWRLPAQEAWRLPAQAAWRPSAAAPAEEAEAGLVAGEDADETGLDAGAAQPPATPAEFGAFEAARVVLTLANALAVAGMHRCPWSLASSALAVVYVAGLAAMAAMIAPDASVFYPGTIWVPLLRAGLAYAAVILTDLLQKSRPLPLKTAFANTHDNWRRSMINAAWILLGNIFVVVPGSTALLSYLIWRILVAYRITMPFQNQGLPSYVNDFDSSPHTSRSASGSGQYDPTTFADSAMYNDPVDDEEEESSVQMRDIDPSAVWPGRSNAMQEPAARAPSSSQAHRDPQTYVYGGSAAPLRHVANDESAFSLSAFHSSAGHRKRGAQTVQPTRKK